MSGEANAAVEATLTGGGDDEYLHIVSYWEWLIADVLRLRIPRSLCGVVLIEDLDRRPAQSVDPLCPRCVEMSDR